MDAEQAPGRLRAPTPWSPSGPRKPAQAAGSAPASSRRSRSVSAGGVSPEAQVIRGRDDPPRRGHPAGAIRPGSARQVLRLQDEILEQRLVLDVRVVLDGAPGAAFLGLHVRAVLWRSRDLDVV